MGLTFTHFNYYDQAPVIANLIYFVAFLALYTTINKPETKIGGNKPSKGTGSLLSHRQRISIVFNSTKNLRSHFVIHSFVHCYLPSSHMEDC